MGRILLVEDDEVIGRVLQAACETWKYESHLVRDGAEAFRAVAGSGEEYDLIICDLQMPRMPGKQFLERVADLVRDEIPVIVLSGARPLIEALGDIRSWLFDVVEKPCDLAALREIVERALEQRRRHLATREDERRVAHLERRVEFLIEQTESMYEESRIDPMTGLPTRRQLEESFDGLSAADGPFGGHFVLALCDMDGFRRMNLQWGYQGGDVAIKHCAALMRAALREGDRIYRYGGDEFILLVDAATLGEGAQAVERVRRHVARAPGVVVDELSVPPLTFSAGITESLALSLPALLERATQALKRAKEAGGNRIRAFPIGAAIEPDCA